MMKLNLEVIKERTKSPIYIGYAVCNLIWIVVFLLPLQSYYSNEYIYSVLAIVVHVIALIPHVLPLVLASMLQVGITCLGLTSGRIKRNEAPVITAHIWFMLVVLGGAAGYFAYRHCTRDKNLVLRDVTEINEDERNGVTRKDTLERWF